MALVYSSNQYFISSDSRTTKLTVCKDLKLEQNLHVDLTVPYIKIPYALNQWVNPKLINFKSIGEAKRVLNDVQKLWIYYPHVENGRGKLIEDQLLKIKSTTLNFLDKFPSSPLGAWTLLDKNTLLYASATTASVPYGLYPFHQNKTEPPSRAYLKLWEFFTRTRLIPKDGLLAIDLGACPGGWTWVLSSLFREVIAIDRSPLDPKVSSLKNVTFYQKDVMNYPDPMVLEKNAWIFSDVALEPEKIVTHLRELKRKRPDISLVCTLKFTNKSDLRILDDLSNTENSNLIHLSANKHEMTWFSINRESLNQAI